LKKKASCHFSFLLFPVLAEPVKFSSFAGEATSLSDVKVTPWVFIAVSF
jgi:hypothetical protein